MRPDPIHSSEREWLDAQTNLPVRVERNRDKVRREFWPKVKRTLAQVPFMDEVLAAYYAALDEKTPTKVRATLLAALAYFILPFDFVPDMILGLGFTDDLTVLLLAFRAASGSIREEHRQMARAKLKELKKEETDATGKDDSPSASAS